MNADPENEIDYIVPIPQNHRRSWQLKGSPAIKIAQALAKKLNCPISTMLRLHNPPDVKSVRRGELDQLSRLHHQLKFSVLEQKCRLLKNQKILLVDDFMTTGKTLATAAEALVQQTQVSNIHIFVLGKRPPNQETSLTEGVSLFEATSQGK